MRMTGEQQIAAPRQKVWEALNDPAVLRASIPGCQSLDKLADDRFAATAEVKIGPIGARFKGDVTLSDIDAPNGYTISGQGSGGIAGNAKGNAKVRLSDHGGGTLVSYEVDADVGGRMAQLGGPIIDATAKQLAGKFFAQFGAVVSKGGVAAPAAVAATAAAAPSVAAAMPGAGSFPWQLAIALILAVLCGILVGRVDQLGYGLVIAVTLLPIAAAWAGFATGRRAP